VTLYVVPCGISIIDGLESGRGRPTGADGGENLTGPAAAWAERLLGGEFTDVEVVASWRSQLGALLDEVALAGWKPAVCAETNTLAHRVSDLTRLLAAPAQNRVVVLASDTAPGLAAAMLVASRIAGDDLGRVRYATADASQPDRTGHRLAYGTVTVLRVFNLAPDAPDGLQTGVAGLGQALRSAHDQSSGAALEVHLTGGFKATLLHLLAMTELLHSLPDSQVTAWYLYDDHPDRSKVVPIGLRRFTDGYLLWAQRELSAVAAGHPPTDVEYTLEGAAWSRQGATAQLNSFGTGFLAVLTPAPPARSDEGG